VRDRSERKRQRRRQTVEWASCGPTGRTASENQAATPANRSATLSRIPRSATLSRIPLAARTRVCPKLSLRIRLPIMCDLPREFVGAFIDAVVLMPPHGRERLLTADTHARARRVAAHAPPSAVGLQKCPAHDPGAIRPDRYLSFRPASKRPNLTRNANAGRRMRSNTV
jgi:hypothetical protein